jgi:hypothetical protein
LIFEKRENPKILELQKSTVRLAEGEEGYWGAKMVFIKPFLLLKLPLLWMDGWMDG